MMKRQKELEEAVKILLRLHSDSKLQFILLTKDPKPNSPLKALHSSIIDEHQRKKIIQVVQRTENEQTTSVVLTNLKDICQIKPAFKQHKMITFSLAKHTQLIDQYKSIIHCLSQRVCAALIKEWVKEVEPRKQANYPYRLGDKSKPPWWPSYIEHIQPDHLGKQDRIELMMEMLHNPDLDLASMKASTESRPAKPVVKRLVNELFYIAAYDRMLYNMASGDSSLEDLFFCLTEEEIDLISEGTISITVSDLPWTTFSRLPNQFNEKVFSLEKS